MHGYCVPVYIRGHSVFVVKLCDIWYLFLGSLWFWCSVSRKRGDGCVIVGVTSTFLVFMVGLNVFVGLIVVYSFRYVTCKGI
jgi:hypothetical protein